MWFSTDDGRTWSKPRALVGKLVDDSEADTGEKLVPMSPDKASDVGDNPSVIQAYDGTILATWRGNIGEGPGMERSGLARFNRAWLETTPSDR